jgi:sugar/nucleoside kinase (ribokinase family)
MYSSLFDVITIGECLVEIMRSKRDVPHTVPGVYLGPYPSGAPAIFADFCARLGLKTRLIGAVGNDDFGRVIIDRLKKSGVDVSKIKILNNYTTGVAFVTYFSTGHRQFIYHIRHAASGQIFPEDVDPSYIEETKLLHIMGSSLAINENCKEACYKAVKLAREKDKLITFDPNLRPELLNPEVIRDISQPVLDVTKIVLPSATEAETLTGISDPLEAGRELLRKGPEIVVIKLGGKGSIVVTKERVLKMPAFRVKEIDPTGAGDVYDAAFIYGILKSWPLDKVLKFANAAGALKVTRFGPMEGPTSFMEVLEFLKRHGESFISREVDRKCS